MTALWVMLLLAQFGAQTVNSAVAPYPSRSACEADAKRQVDTVMRAYGAAIVGWRCVERLPQPVAGS